jgi:hypothetical protein
MDPMGNDADEDDFEACFDVWPDQPVELVPPSFDSGVAPLFRGWVRETWRRPGRMERAIRGPNLVNVATEGGLLANTICVVDDDRPIVKLHALFVRARGERQRVALADVPVWDRRQYILMRDWLLCREDWRSLRIVQVPFEVEWALTIAAKSTLQRILDDE